MERGEREEGSGKEGGKEEGWEEGREQEDREGEGREEQGDWRIIVLIMTPLSHIHEVCPYTQGFSVPRLSFGERAWERLRLAISPH